MSRSRAHHRNNARAEDMPATLLRALPAVDEVLRQEPIRAQANAFSHAARVRAARAVLSWFPESQRPGTTTAQISRVLNDLTEWALRPLRRVIPPAGMFDLSFLVLVFFLIFLRTFICG